MFMWYSYALGIDVLLNGHSTLAKGELQSLCCMMGKIMSFDVTFWLLMVGDWQASFGASEQPYFAEASSVWHMIWQVWFDAF